MQVYRLHRTQILPVSLETAWEFLCRPEHLQDLTPPGIGLTVTSDLPERGVPGAYHYIPAQTLLDVLL